MIQKVASNSLKFGYVQVETLKFPRPCTLACNCKIIWDSDFDKVGGLPSKFRSYPLGEASRKMLNFNFPGKSLLKFSPPEKSCSTSIYKGIPFI